MTADSLPHRLDRTILIQAAPDEVFRFFTDDERWASWWGAGSSIDPRIGGRVRICLPGGVEIGGEVLELAPPRLIVFTYGFASGTPFPDGSSRVTVTLDTETGGATRLRLSHAFALAADRDRHVQGWRYQLSVFANVAANAAHAGAGALVDDWFAAWSEPDAEAREALLDRIATPGIRVRDRFSAIEGTEDLRPHLAAVHQFMPGIRLTREGDARHCQGAVLAAWVARAADGQERGRGTSLFLLSPAGRITDVVGFWT